MIRSKKVSYARFLHFRPRNSVMEEILLWQRERENVWTRPSYGVFGGHFMP